MIVVIGCGIVGAATARRLAETGRDVVVVDREPHAAAHQSGRNSGVVHSGIYYRPGSKRQRLTRDGRQRLAEFATERNLPWQPTPKLIVATEKDELPRLRALEQQAKDNGIATERLGRQGIADAEPGIVGRSALRLTTTAITDFRSVTEALLDDVRSLGGSVRFGVTIESVSSSGIVVARDDNGPLTFDATGVVSCAGLGTIPLARSAGDPTNLSAVPFRGSYWTTTRTMQHMVYPVADPRFPFLGAHFTPTLDGDTHVGPTATLTLGPDADRRFSFDRAQTARLAVDPAVRRLAARAWPEGVAESIRSVSARALVARCRRLMPDLTADELVPARAGIRAQALRPDGSLVDDFVITRTTRAMHVLNAPSPAATASLAIAADIVDAVAAHW